MKELPFYMNDAMKEVVFCVSKYINKSMDLWAEPGYRCGPRVKTLGTLPNEPSSSPEVQYNGRWSAHGRLLQSFLLSILNYFEEFLFLKSYNMTDTI